MKEHLLFRMLEFGAKRRGVFTKRDLEKYLGADWDEEYFEKMSGTKPDPTNFFLTKNFIDPDSEHGHNIKFEPASEDDSSSGLIAVYEFILSPVGMATYIEMLELHEARKTAQDARKMSAAAIEIALGIGLVQVFLAFLALALR